MTTSEVTTVRSRMHSGHRKKAVGGELGATPIWTLLALVMSSHNFEANEALVVVAVSTTPKVMV